MSTLKTDLLVKDVLLPADQVPVVTPKTLLKETLEHMSKKNLGIACIVDDDNRLAGIFTDGDIRRMLLKDQKPFPALFADDTIQHATTKPTVVSSDMPLTESLAIMEAKRIWDLPVVTSDGEFIGLLHLHPAISVVMGL